MCPRSWNWRSLRSTTACPSVRSVPDGSMPSLTRSGRCSRRAAEQPLGQAVGGQDLGRPGRRGPRSASRSSGGRSGTGWRRSRSRRSVCRSGPPPLRAHPRWYTDTVGLAGQPEPPRAVGGGADADPGAGLHHAGRRRGRHDSRRTGESGVAQVDAVVVGAQAEAAGQPGRAAGQVARRAARPAAGAGPRRSRRRPRRRAAARPRRPRPAAHDVRAPVHAVGEVAVEVPGRPEHDRGARGAARGRRARPGRRRPRRPRPRSAGRRPARRRRRRSAPRRAAAAPTTSAGPASRSRPAVIGRSGSVAGPARLARGRRSRQRASSWSATRSGAVPPTAERAAERAGDGQHVAHLGRQGRRRPRRAASSLRSGRSSPRSSQ